MYDTIVYQGKEIPMEEFHKQIALEGARKFAYDPQLQLFPEPKVEEARANLREQFDSGKTIDVVVIKE
jgi:hypothetical protein